MVKKSKPLIKAIEEDDESTVRSLIKKGTNVNITDDESFTALMLASARGNINIIRMLLKAGADVNATCDIGWTALRIAFDVHKTKKFLEIYRLLTDAGAVDIPSISGETVLSEAKQRNKKQVVVKLLQDAAKQEKINVNRRKYKLFHHPSYDSQSVLEIVHPVRGKPKQKQQKKAVVGHTVGDLDYDSLYTLFQLLGYNPPPGMDIDKFIQDLKKK